MNSRGLAFLLNNNFKYKEHNIHKDNSGDFLIPDTIIENMNLLLENICGPNLDTPNFYSEIIGKYDSCPNTKYVLTGGDFNLALYKDSDSMNYKHLDNPK